MNDHNVGNNPPSDFSIGSPIWPGLGKLSEECGELLQVCGKLIGSGGVYHHWDGTHLLLRMEEEAADVLAAIDFLREHNRLDGENIERRRKFKLEQFNKWHADSTTETEESREAESARRWSGFAQRRTPERKVHDQQ
jgi:NTP pyrophosphatase (non-canonical NTP hydrolase)